MKLHKYYNYIEMLSKISKGVAKGANARKVSSTISRLTHTCRLWHALSEVSQTRTKMRML